MPEPTTTAPAAPAAAPPAAAPAAPAEAASALGTAVTETPADAKPADAKAPEAAPAETKPAELELKAPEGFKDDAAVAGIKALAGELGLDSPKAQKVLERFAAWQGEATKQAEEAFTQQDKSWAEALQKDPDIGGQKWDAARKDIGRAVQHFKAQGAMRALHSVGLGNHPELVKLMAAVGRALREDRVAGTSAAPAPSERLSDAVLFYGPNTNAPKEG